MLFKGYGWTPYVVEGDDPATMHQLMAAVMEHCVLEIRAIQKKARSRRRDADAAAVADDHSAHAEGMDVPEGDRWAQAGGLVASAPDADSRSGDEPENLEAGGAWMRSYKPEELFDERALIAELREMAPKGQRRITANPHANGGLLRKPLELPDFRDYAVKVEKPGRLRFRRPTLAHFLRDVMRKNMTSFRVFGPDETASNKLEAIYEASPARRGWRRCCRRMRTAAILRRWPRDGDAERAHAGGLVRRLCADGTAWVLFDL
jgi:xylulose-5-phosphate/fructose-6-phosphate phosphoketolase